VWVQQQSPVAAARALDCTRRQSATIYSLALLSARDGPVVI